MAYVAPLGSTKLVDAASVANGAYCAAALLPITGTRQVIFTVLCDQAFDFDCGTVAQVTVTAAELDKDRGQSSTANAAVSVYGSVQFTVSPDNDRGYVWCRVQNVSGAAGATITVYGKQL